MRNLNDTNGASQILLDIATKTLEEFKSNGLCKLLIFKRIESKFRYKKFEKIRTFNCI